MPSSRMNTGSNASAAVLRNSSSSGPRISETGRYQPISSPSGTPAPIAMRKPTSERTRLARVLSHSWPSLASSIRALTASENGTRNVRSTSPTRGATSHSTRNAAIATVRLAPTPSAWATRPRGAGTVRFSSATVGVNGISANGNNLPHRGDLLAQQAPDLMPVGRELRTGAHVVLGVAVPEPYVHDLLDPAGPRGHHRDALPEIDGLVDAVRDEHDR